MNTPSVHTVELCTKYRVLWTANPALSLPLLHQRHHVQQLHHQRQQPGQLIPPRLGNNIIFMRVPDCLPLLQPFRLFFNQSQVSVLLWGSWYYCGSIRIIVAVLSVFVGILILLDQWGLDPIGSQGILLWIEVSQRIWNVPLFFKKIPYFFSCEAFHWSVFSLIHSLTHGVTVSFFEDKSFLHPLVT